MQTDRRSTKQWKEWPVRRTSTKRSPRKKVPSKVKNENELVIPEMLPLAENDSLNNGQEQRLEDEKKEPLVIGSSKTTCSDNSSNRLSRLESIQGCGNSDGRS